MDFGTRSEYRRIHILAEYWNNRRRLILATVCLLEGSPEYSSLGYFEIYQIKRWKGKEKSFPSLDM